MIFLKPKITRIIIPLVALAVIMTAGVGQMPVRADDQITIGALNLDAQGFYGGIKKGIEAGAGMAKIRLLGQNIRA